MKEIYLSLVACTLSMLCCTSCFTEQKNKKAINAKEEVVPNKSVSEIPEWAKKVLCSEQISSARKAGVPPAIELRLDKEGKVVIKMLFIPPGEFMMGFQPEIATKIGKDRWFSSRDRKHKVKISKGYYLSITEITQEQWTAVMGNNPSFFQKGINNCVKDTVNNPVEQVSWEDVQKFVEKLKINGANGLRLPTEAEWEYACRAGTTTRMYYGNDNGYRHLHEYAWYFKIGGTVSSMTHPVGEKKPNRWGLFDMTGNVWEWCNDWYETYGLEEQKDPTGPAKGTKRILRGGSWLTDGHGCRVACREIELPDKRSKEYGFRIVKDVPR